MQSTAIYGGSFNPPGLHHRAIAIALLQHFQSLMIVPCGLRNDKLRAGSGMVAPAMRRQLVKAGFADITDMNRIIFDWHDLETDTFTPTIELAERYKAQGDIWFVIGADLYEGGHNEQSQIQRSWLQGQRVWNELQFACLTRPGWQACEADLPPHNLPIPLEIAGSSSEIRRYLNEGLSIEGLVTNDVARIIYHEKLYRS